LESFAPRAIAIQAAMDLPVFASRFAIKLAIPCSGDFAMKHLALSAGREAARPTVSKLCDRTRLSRGRPAADAGDRTVCCPILPSPLDRFVGDLTIRIEDSGRVQTKEMLMRMKIACSFSAVVVSIVVVGTSIAGDAVQSGLKIGESTTAFQVDDITGPNKGTSLCYR
jgi:hypothetical protein